MNKPSLLFAALALLPAAAQADYSFVDLGTLSDASSFGRGVNNAGQVAGYATTTSGATTTASDAYSWQNGTQTALGQIQGQTRSVANAITGDGTVAGYASSSQFIGYHATVWKNGVATDLGPALAASGLNTTGYNSYVYGVSAGGAIVGQYTPNGQNQTRAFLDDHGTFTDMGYLSIPTSIGNPVVSASAVNASDTVVGFSYLTGGNYHAYSWTRTGGMVDLGTLGGAYSSAYGINDAGTIVGDAFLAGSGYHAFSYSGGRMSDLGTLAGYSEARAINNGGLSVGYSYADAADSSASKRGVLFQNGQVVDLNTLLPTGTNALITDAWSINDNGWIAGDATINGATHGFLLQANPVPEPAPLLALAGGVLALSRRRKRA